MARGTSQCNIRIKKNEKFNETKKSSEEEEDTNQDGKVIFSFIIIGKDERATSLPSSSTQIVVSNISNNKIELLF